MVEYRAVPEDDVDAYEEVLDYAFRAEAGPAPDRGDGSLDAVIERRAFYDGEAIVCTAAHHAFTATVRGRWQEVAGLGGVATPPERRRQGLVRRLLRASLEERREQGRSFSLLWPFKHAFYRRFGWGRLADHGRYEVAPAALGAVVDHPLAGGEFRRLEVGDHPALQALDERSADRHDLAMRRTEDWYRHRFFEGRETDPFVYGWQRDGELGGYLRYDVRESEDGSQLRVWEFGAPGAEAVVNLLRFLYRHEAQVDGVRLHAPVDDLLFDLVDDPRAVDLAVYPGPMGRLVDVVAALEALPAPGGVEASVTLEVRDALADWNDGAFAVEARDGAFAVEPGAVEGPRARLPVETLSRLAFGTTTAERAAVAGGLEAGGDAIATLDDLFPPREVFLREFF